MVLAGHTAAGRRRREVDDRFVDGASFLFCVAGNKHAVFVQSPSPLGFRRQRRCAGARPAPYRTVCAGMAGARPARRFVFMGRGLGASGSVSAVVAGLLDFVAPDTLGAASGWRTISQCANRRGVVVFEGRRIRRRALSGLLARRAMVIVERAAVSPAHTRLLLAFGGGMLMAFGAALAAAATAASTHRGCSSSRQLAFMLIVLRRLRVRLVCQRDGDDGTISVRAVFDPTSLVVAFIIGSASASPRAAGFGSARKPLSQF